MSAFFTRTAMKAVEQGWVPDSIVRSGIRSLCRQRMREIQIPKARQSQHLDEFVRNMGEAPVAPLVHKANEQHYEVPAAFFQQVLGAQLKYSSSFWDGVDTLDQAELQALALSCEHADLKDGQEVLELGCGWGSLTLWMAKSYPNSTITAVSNSHSQRSFIEQRAMEAGLGNVRVITADINHFSMDQGFDRILSVEMFEHLRNYASIFDRVAGWLKPDGRFFMHIFCHHSTPYLFEVRDDTDWMSRYFFSGGMMPSADLPLKFQDSLCFANRWDWSGVEYQKTAEAWLDKLDAARDEVFAIFSDTYGQADAKMWVNRWRIFFMACAELFGMRGGDEWRVSHFLFNKR
ncbi:MAG TPA: SAM-dependent methyltransferase [Gammaproteobacteria bacterium]|jgi:cyclopropane-fatty-acyl-phospholipid synthase|nr:SAM-dependent methyltransferase [Gammaproteobacteria bacterium]HBP84959.1 SAM-dependent methyltransferase [Gammaproteobacteria bacterium]|tara:strand:- start:189 stop:1229 length:1041 start_codon:yes stop_codon:yes gene_type:complete